VYHKLRSAKLPVLGLHSSSARLSGFTVCHMTD